MRNWLYLNGKARKILILFSGLSFVCGYGFAASPVSYPGAVWMQSGTDGHNIEGANTMGFVRQGVGLKRFSGGQLLQAYGRYNWRFRSLNNDYYNAYAPYVGAMVSFKYVDLGAEMGWPRYTEIDRNMLNHSIFANWFRYWSLTDWRKDRLLKAMPLSTWGNVAYDLTNQDGSSTMGWIKLEADVLWLPHDFMVGPYVSYNWRFRTRNADYFNMQGVFSGIAIGNGYLIAGTQYAWRQYPELHRQTHSFEVFISLYKAWDLKRGGSSLPVK